MDHIPYFVHRVRFRIENVYKIAHDDIKFLWQWLPQLLPALKKLKAVQETESAVHGPQWNPEGYLFINRSGNAMDNGMERERWRKLLADSGVEYKRRHIGRHSSALVMDDGEKSSKLLGHSSMQVTVDLYGHMKPGTLTESLSKALQSVFTSSQSEL
jgi:integrase